MLPWTNESLTSWRTAELRVILQHSAALESEQLITQQGSQPLELGVDVVEWTGTVRRAC